MQPHEELSSTLIDQAFDRSGCVPFSFDPTAAQSGVSRCREAAIGFLGRPFGHF
jgi:hypothetical protein